MFLSRSKGFIVMAIAAALVLPLDQAAKAWVTGNMAVNEARPIAEGFFRLRYTQNTGAAFGFFQGWTGALSIAAVAIIIAIIVSASRAGQGSTLLMLALGLVTGGALGNLTDRLRLGYVVDFFEVYGPRLNINNIIYTWPVFNVADSAITVGVLLLMAGFLFGQREESPEARNEAAGRQTSSANVHPARLSGEGYAVQPTANREWTEPTAAGWAGMVVVMVGFLLMALRESSRRYGQGGG